MANSRKKKTITTIPIAPEEIEEQSQDAANDTVDEATEAPAKPKKAVGTITLKKAKIKDDLFLDVEYSETLTDGENKINKASTAPIHNDLKAAFRRLDEHLGRISEQYNSMGELDGINMNCKGFTIGGSGDSEGVTLIGYRGLDSGKYLNLVSPFTKWEGDDYEYADELAEIIEQCKFEVMEYLFKSKHAPQAQYEIEFPDQEM